MVAPGPEPALDDPDVPTDAGLSSTRAINLKGRSLRQHTARGTLINTGFLVGLSTLGLLRGFILAALLTAADYGVWGILVVSLATIMWLKKGGIGDKYIQQDDPDQETAFQKAFTLEAMLTGLFMLLLLAALPLMVLVYGETQLLAPGLVLVLVLPAGVLQAPLWVYYRNMDFFRQRALQAIDPVVGFVVAVAAAVAGAGYWAFAAGVLAGAWSSALAAMIASPYRLRFRYDRGTLKTYASFSWPLFIAGGSALVVAQTAVIASEATLGLAGAGAIALASNITSFTHRVDGLITETLYPAICTVRDRVDLLKESFVKSNRLALMWAIPFGIGLALFSGDLVSFAIGEKWRPAAELLRITGVTAALGQIAYNWSAYMRATDRTRPIAVAAIASMVTFVAVGLPLLIAYGLTGLAVGIALQTAANVCFRIYYLHQLFSDFSYLRQAMRAVAPVLPAVAVVFAARALESGERTAAMAGAELLAYLLAAVVATWLLEGRLLREAVGYIARRPASAASA